MENASRERPTLQNLSSPSEFHIDAREMQQGSQTSLRSPGLSHAKEPKPCCVEECPSVTHKHKRLVGPLDSSSGYSNLPPYPLSPATVYGPCSMSPPPPAVVEAGFNGMACRLIDSQWLNRAKGGCIAPPSNMCASRSDI